MAKIEKLVPGQILWDVKRNSGFKAMYNKYSSWPVQVVEVNVEGGYIIARWNWNEPKRMGLKSIKSLRIKEPK